ncbi:hypothetical protein PFICI_01329 [Pestalotiopsis fici W106-1]|uniref:Gcp-like domain-containing protein n=1 Tax=Pestalotiopsis fici (strain W106-1 / CGMCC3.15140) TaxID=1229662 RepID=W3XQF9_PESFW|nr:uncharacterized protein PFICI_01329 [Pestalotiopsis fici W106-1]ETS87501.1 hypothetical protein PFICI_01329 [Pestalotiopsis fici W106-1]
MSAPWCSSIRASCAPHSLARRVLRQAAPSAFLLRPRFLQRRTLLTLAIESSCDDTCVAILDKPDLTVHSRRRPHHQHGDDGNDSAPVPAAAHLLFNKKVTSDNRAFGGVEPLTAVLSHTSSLAPLVREALQALPEVPAVEIGDYRVWKKMLWVDGVVRRKPDFVSVTRGPGMASNLSVGLNTAKGLAVAWDVPLLGVNHMQAHALTPRLVSALERGAEELERRQQQQSGTTAPKRPRQREQQEIKEPAFPFLSLLVSGGHTLLVHSRSLTDHRILAQTRNIAIGDMIDKCARIILPASHLAELDDVMYGPALERFAFPDVKSPEDYGYTPPAKRMDEIQIFDSGRGWALTPPIPTSAAMVYDFSGFNGEVERAVRENPDMSLEDRRYLAKHAMRIAFEHLVSRLLFALKDRSQFGDIKTIVAAGGVASNKYLRHIMKSMLEVRGHGHLVINAPPPALCTDNAAMIAWTGMEMYEAGWRSELNILAARKWPIDPEAQGGGILGEPGWVNVNKV